MRGGRSRRDGEQSPPLSDLSRSSRLSLRPHIKTHKIPEFAHLQIKLGAKGINCQKLGEAEVIADAGIGDILLTYNLIGQTKLDRLVALARRSDIKVVADLKEIDRRPLVRDVPRRS